MKKRIIIGLLPTLLGGLIYLTYRTDSLLMFSWFEKIGLKNFVNFLRINAFLQSIQFPNWVKFSLPDALWLLSFTYILLLLWDYKINRQSAFWIFIAPVIGIFSEVGQFFGIVQGTFDITDLSLLIIATTIPFFLTINLQTSKNKIVW